MAETDTSQGGVMNSLRRVGRSLLGLMRNRVELFAVELQEEKLRALTLMAWFAAAVVLGAAGVLVAIGALALFLWQTAGYAGLAGLALCALVGSAAIFWGVRRWIIHGPAPFAETVAEFRRDAASLEDSR